jgi:ABC-type transport system involved in multi-copper enzyme maturation permease subunit
MEDAGVPGAPSAGFTLDQITVGTVLFGQLIAGVLGVLIISGEYASGTIQTTLISVPSRVTVLAAKAVTVFVATMASGLIALFGSWAATYPMFANLGLDIALTTPGVAFALIGGSVYVGLSAVLGLGIGTLLRSVAASVAAVLSIILLLPIVISVLPFSPWLRNLHLLTMSKAGDSMSSLADASGAFLNFQEGYVSPAAGWTVALFWAGAFLVLGAIRLRKEDA